MGRDGLEKEKGKPVCRQAGFKREKRADVLKQEAIFILPCQASPIIVRNLDGSIPCVSKQPEWQQQAMRKEIDDDYQNLYFVLYFKMNHR